MWCWRLLQLFARSWLNASVASDTSLATCMCNLQLLVQRQKLKLYSATQQEVLDHPMSKPLPQIGTVNSQTLPPDLQRSCLHPQQCRTLPRQLGHSLQRYSQALA